MNCVYIPYCPALQMEFTMNLPFVLAVAVVAECTFHDDVEAHEAHGTRHFKELVGLAVSFPFFLRQHGKCFHSSNRELLYIYGHWQWKVNFFSFFSRHFILYRFVYIFWTFPATIQEKLISLCFYHRTVKGPFPELSNGRPSGQAPVCLLGQTIHKA